MGEQPDRTKLRDLQDAPSVGALNWLPPFLGVLAGWVAFRVGGLSAGAWLLGGIFLGGFVPFYLMPWLRRRRR